METLSRLARRRRVPLLVIGLALAACGGSPPGTTGPAATGSGGPAPTGGLASPLTASPASRAPTTPTVTTAPPSVASPSGATAIAGCAAPANLTPAQTEGPYFKAGSPERSSLVEPGMAGTRLVLTGFVVTTACLPLAGAKIDIWQADAQGAYDNAGYRLRGHVFTDITGAFQIATVVPGEYPGRTPHIHVKVTPAGGDTLITQLYFPDQAGNSGDRIFRAEMVLDIKQTADGQLGRFTFVLSGG